MIARSLLSPRRGLSKAARVLAATCVVLSVAAAPRVFAQGANSGVLPPGSTISDLVYGTGIAAWWYGIWSAVWWQWLLAIPTGPGTDQNPLHDSTGMYCGANQSGPVWFLTGTVANGQPVTRNCLIPSAMPVFVPLAMVKCSTLDASPFHCTNATSCRSCATTIVDGINLSSLTISIDDMQIKDGIEAYRSISPLFSFLVPGQNILNSPSGSGMAVSAGYWLMLKSMSPGRHTIHIQGQDVRGLNVGVSEDVTYSIDVTP